MKRSDHGFTLLELMIVIAVLVIIAAIAIPNLLISLNGGREAAAIGSMRTLSTAAEQYRLRQGSYPSDLEDLAAVDPALVDSELANGLRNGYNFQLSGQQSTFDCFADPISENGSRFFFVDETGVIRQSDSGTAGPGDHPVG
ncbi:MAG: prepilin-type N-terminal cleavage/methylation domain-containing protein [Planctomycetia bacterium]|jgi:type IV pilus assembly protein PilA|nr:prepilin-type N-terminal cleavage/methylation domain-containing protein [Planctomycetia bacterium]NCF98721.1 prepilin-type N-terminal cleavage/methylation domain-containing protein [Planctomycetia bacterium]NCG13728.1 prepilin-type N-terminal cleavage/methylation domain-containing protein [Planctomycetia bacterium]NCG57233.1 prepilin-type N-terminal cleavage/methylation domain-containing protein [Pseudomonadota bacterium]